MKKTVSLLMLFFELFVKTVSAQQDPMYSMYIFDKMLINPAFTGSSNWAVATLKYREQFTGFNGHPSTKTFNFHSPVQKKHLGLGFKIISDKVALISNLTFAPSISYHLNFAGGKLSLGLEAGIINKKINYQELIVSKLGDNALATNNTSSLLPDASYGFYYQKKQLYLGFSQYHIIKSKYRYNTPVSQAHLFSYYYFLIGNVFQLQKKVSLEPCFLVKYLPGVKPQIDINTTVYYNDQFGLGLQYRSGDAIVAFFKIMLGENIRISYAYDYTLSKLAPYSNGCHELILSYGIKLPPPPSQKEIHPRYYF